MAQATAPILDFTSSSNCCNAPIRELSEAQRTCRERRERVDLTKMTHLGSGVCIRQSRMVPDSRLEFVGIGFFVSAEGHILADGLLARDCRHIYFLPWRTHHKDSI